MIPDTNRLPCLLINHSCAHEVQVVAQVFFPNTGFAFDLSHPPAEGLYVLSRLDGEVCTGALYRDGRRLAAYSLSVAESGTGSLKRTLMLALFRALKTVLDTPTPWGALTGVRPAKQVRLWLEEGDDEALIRERLATVYHCREDKIKLAMAVARAETSLIAQTGKGAGLYVGIPFCPSRCLYCSFVAAQKSGPEIESRYLQALKQECFALRESGHRFNAVYIGGGTPTALSERHLADLLEMLAECFGSFRHIEFTVEAGRPDTLTPEKLRLLKNHEVNRLAINPQTLSDETLRRIGRGHDAQAFFIAFEMARKAGFDNINTDVIAGLPGETTADMRRTMEGLRTLAPEHITVHTLAVKRASRLNERLADYPAPSFEAVDAMLSIARENCEAMGLSPYYMYRQKNMAGHFENVGYALPGRECLYNAAMMAETQTVWAVGAGGVTKRVEGSKIERVFNPKNPEIYIERH